MKKIHSVQLEMWRELSKLLDIMNIQYFFVHGSLLGAVTMENFIKEDDDIDIAIFRNDYERLIREGNKYLPEHYFIQSCLNDDFPLAFSKFRDSRTAFIQPVLKNYKCNKGIYIDIFPIDFFIENEKEHKKFILKERLLSTRIGFRLKQKGGLKLWALRLLSFLYCPSYLKAVKLREVLYNDLKPSNFVTITNGKVNERKLPIDWFKQTIKLNFCGVSVTCPMHYKEYLSTIYGDKYMTYNPAKNRIYSNQMIEVSADIIDFNHSYQIY